MIKFLKLYGNMSIIGIALCFVLYFFSKTLKDGKTYKAELDLVKERNTAIKDSLLRNAFETAYLKKILGLKVHNPEGKLTSGLKIFELKDGKPAKKVDLSLLTNTPKKKLFIRYTEIGCNACSDSTFKFIRNRVGLVKEYDVYTLVDFSDYMAYLKWVKFADVPGKILWVKKGDLPFKLETYGESYIFTVNNERLASNFFVPNSMMSTYLKDYIATL